jgi:hypothetical protein
LIDATQQINNFEQKYHSGTADKTWAKLADSVPNTPWMHCLRHDARSKQGPVGSIKRGRKHEANKHPILLASSHIITNPLSQLQSRFLFHIAEFI